MDALFEQSQKTINRVNMKFQRSLYHHIDWNCRLIEINGARGVGKTTMLLQRAKESGHGDPGSVLYLSLDDPYFYTHSIIDTADYFLKYGGIYLFLDEVHKYPSKLKGYDWSAELKVIYDRYPDLKIVYSGSSVLQLFKGHGDLSRGKCGYNLPGLSFREYVNWIKDKDLPAITLEEILDNHQKIAGDISLGIKILPLYDSYIRHGYYPFYHEAPDQYCARLKDTINVILEQDLQAVAPYASENHYKLKKLLGVISDSVPITPNLTKLRSELFIADHRTLLNYLDALEKAELLTTLEKHARGMKKLHKPSKIYLNNTNLLFCMYYDKPNEGNIRETFFFNQVRNLHKVNYPAKGDFLIDSKYVFEVGGKNKSNLQLQNIPDSYRAIANIETGFGNKIPLWLFGFLY